MLKTNKQNPKLSVETLVQALPYIQKFRGHVFVIKYGGAAMKDEEFKNSTIRDIVLLSCVGIKPILVHGGGPEISRFSEKLEIPVNFINGHRVTDERTMEVVEMVLVGKVQRELVNLININGGDAIGLSGKDGKLFTAKPMTQKKELGFIGDVLKIDITILNTLMDRGFIPVVSSVGADSHGQNYNINADRVAAAIAEAMSASKLILMTDTPGLLKNPKDPKSLISKLSVKEAKALIKSKVVSGGMIPKVQSALEAISNSVNAVHIINGGFKHSLLLEIFTDSGIGTMFTKQ